MRGMVMAVGTAVMLATAGVGNAVAAEKTWERISAEEFLTLMESDGFAGELSVDGEGDPMVVGRLNGVEYNVYFYDCDMKKRCTSFEFHTAWVNNGSTTMQDMNNWNQSHRFGTAFLDPDGDPAVSYSFLVKGGASTELVKDCLDWWRVIVRDFEKIVG